MREYFLIGMIVVAVVASIGYVFFRLFVELYYDSVHPGVVFVLHPSIEGLGPIFPHSSVVCFHVGFAGVGHIHDTQAQCSRT